MNPQTNIKIDLHPFGGKEPGSNEPARNPWLIMTVSNKGSTPWHFTRDAFLAGMQIEIKKKDGHLVSLNRRGREMAEFTPSYNHRRIVILQPGGHIDFDLPLGDYAILKPGVTYSVKVCWTLNFYSEHPKGRPLETALPKNSTIVSSSLALTIPHTK